METETKGGCYNIGPNIRDKMNKGLHLNKRNPICILKNKIHEHFGGDFVKFDDLNPLVSVEDNFDKLLVPKDHPSRSMIDTYYFNPDTVLRTHTTAHQCQLLESGYTQFLVTGDVFRKDSIDRFHYPIFHQMEGVEVFEKNGEVMSDLIVRINELIYYLFGDCEWRSNDHEFPFTDPSFEVEIKWKGEWIEVLGCGIIKEEILENCGFHGKEGYAFGLGLERLAMILFDIPDIRYFWSEDERFLKQFGSGEIKKFEPYSNYPPIYKDISFWYDKSDYEPLDLYDIVREEAPDIIEDIQEIDDFFHPKELRTSKTYRLTFRHNDRSLTHEEVNGVNNKIYEKIEEKLNVEAR